MHGYISDLPNICRYLGTLKAVPTLDKLSVLIGENIDRYTCTQLAHIAYAYGNCRLHSKYLFALLAKQLQEKIQYASNHDLTTIANAFGKSEAFALAKHRDMELFNILSHMAKVYLNSQDLNNVADPEISTRVVRAFCTLKINDITLFNTILENVAERPYNYPPAW
ncbi:uncharacterized protein BXIN_2265 [Babesia sp. Xinjiang]|uniref:uncharacterized protein n=1 Tax=Babesia sp. Xinjiang TaxID=462227 RepID=UPI000A251568|nr:uncharacterized protein BXIN_2265 [Babesia sp. Xinjiang]ORM40804.1 hypothetical protein BXIN_2265 [Babesia sp. Xinjiang]